MTERHRIPVTAGEDLIAVVHGSGDEWIVFSHGLVSDKEGSYEGRCEEAAARGYAAVRFDHRGCGESDGRFERSSLGERVRDLEAVLDALVPDRPVLAGSSFGGAVCLAVAAKRDSVSAVATRAPVTDLSRLAALEGADGTATLGEEYSLGPAWFEDLQRHDLEETLRAVDCPVMIVHGAEDASVPFSDSVAALEALEGDVVLERLTEEGHRFSRAGEAYLRTRLFDWLAAIEPER